MPLLAKQCLSCAASLPADSLTCEFCGTAHLVQADGSGLACACPSCGHGNRPDAKHCVQCAKPLLLPCPECQAQNPLGSRFCHECRIEFRSYRSAQLRAAPNMVPLEGNDGVDRQVMDWLEGRWFKARDIREKLKILERTLVWVPVWTFQSRVKGEVQGQVSQTHYRTTTSREYDHEAERWVDKPDSEPYTVWNEVRKDFDQRLVRTRLGNLKAERLADALDDSAHLTGARVLPEGQTLGGADYERVFEPTEDEGRAFAILRAEARHHLQQTLLDKVEKLDLHFHQPTLTLAFYPIWDVVYRYRKSHGSVRVRGSDGHVTGKRVTLLSQWFG
jgi:hypothetical protein